MSNRSRGVITRVPLRIHSASGATLGKLQLSGRRPLQRTAASLGARSHFGCQPNNARFTCWRMLWTAMFRTLARIWDHLRRRDLREMAVVLSVSLLLLGSAKLASEVVEGDTTTFDTRVLLAFQDPDNPGHRIGPAWLEPMVRDLTSLGGITVVVLVVAAVLGFLLVAGKRRTAAQILVSVAGGGLLLIVLKTVFQRDRPTLIGHGVAVTTTSFPSGHAMLAAIVYLTLGALLATVQKDALARSYCIATAIALTLLVGISRVYMGVHWPTDVLAGWCVGAAWAMLCLLVSARWGPDSPKR